MAKNEALKLALEALESCYESDTSMYRSFDKRKTDSAINAIKEALAQPDQDGQCKLCADGCPACDARKLPAQRTWVGLTDDEYAKLAEEFGPFPINQIEAKLKEKNT
jgi:hypothetical protein